MNVSDLIDIHKGKVGFILGAGPSLRHISTESLTPYVSVAVNSSVSKFREADFFLTDDVDVRHWDYYQKVLPKINCTCLLYRAKLDGYAGHLTEKRVIWFTHKTWYQPSTKKYFEDGLVLTKDEPIIGARTAMGSAVHFLYIMGCDPIVLLGCDCCYEKGKRYFWQFQGEKHCHRLDGQNVFSTPNKGKCLGQQVDQHSLDFLVYWSALAKQTEKQGVNVINASGGILQWFPRMSFDEVLGKYGERRK
jgi:hypothetical protein